MTTIRPARVDDDAALAAIDVATWSPQVTPAPAPPADQSFFGPGTDPGEVLVAEVDGRVAAYVWVGQQVPLASHDHVLDLKCVAVHPDHQGAGLGRLLVEAAVQVARDRGARKLVLRVLGPNARARSLYASCGFVVEGVLRDEFHLDGRDVDDVLMAHRLGR